MKGDHSGWATVETEVGTLISDSVFPSDAALQIRRFMSFIRDRYVAPEQIDIGSRHHSICFCWVSRGLEIEAYADQLEFYRFFDGRTDVRYFPFAPDGTVSSELLEELNEQGTSRVARVKSGPLR